MLNAKFLQPTANSRADYHLIQIRIQFHLNQEVKFISRNINDFYVKIVIFRLIAKAAANVIHPIIRQD